MKVRILIASLCMWCLSGCYSGKFKKLQEKLEALRVETVPDSRIDLWQVNLKREKGKNLIVKGELLSTETKQKILQLIEKDGFRIKDSLVILPDTTTQGKNWGLVRVSVANLRSKPAHAAEMVTQAIMGTPVRILKKNGGWCFIQTPDHYLSWVTGSSLEIMDEKALDLWNCSDRVIFSGNYGVITNATNDDEIITDLVTGSIFKKISEEHGICTVALPDGRTGKISAEKILNFGQWMESQDITGEKLVNAARKFLGIPYLWGGTSSKGVDCSGLVKSAFFLNGFILERDASQQFRHGEKIDPDAAFSNVQAGDLFFFGRKEPLRVTHVGMSIGMDKVIHSSVSNARVYINSLIPDQPGYSESLRESLVGIRRVIGLPSQFGYMPVGSHEWYR